MTQAEYDRLLAEREARNAPEAKRPSQAAQEEGRLQSDVEQWLTSKQIWWYHDNDSRKSRPGIPDLLICYHGQFVAAELKSKTGKLKESQRNELARIRKSKGRTFVARSLEEFIEKLINGVQEQYPN